MADITATELPDKKLIVFTICGHVAVGDLSRILERFQGSTSRYPFAIWDASHGSMAELESTDLQRLIEQLKKGRGVQKGGKTALVGLNEDDYGAGRMFETYTGMEELHARYKTFRNLSDAMEWMESE